MPQVRYENFLVDPWKGTREAEAANMRRNELDYRKQEADRRNVLDQRRVDQYDTAEQRRHAQGERTNALAQKQYDLDEADKRRKVKKEQVVFAYKVLKDVKDEPSYQAARANMQQFVKSGLYEPDSEFANMPEKFDQARHNQFLAFAEALMENEGKKESGGFTLSPGQTRYGPDGKVIASAPGDEGGSGSGKADKDLIKLPDGSVASRDDLRSEFKLLYNLPDELDLKIMEASSDPAQKAKAKALRQKSSEAEFGKFMSRVKKDGRWYEKEESAKPTPAPAQAKPLTRDKAVEYMRKANGDKAKAMQLAKQDGYEF